jgi:hypothetical protein
VNFLIIALSCDICFHEKSDSSQKCEPRPCDNSGDLGGTMEGISHPLTALFKKVGAEADKTIGVPEEDTKKENVEIENAEKEMVSKAAAAAAEDTDFKPMCIKGLVNMKIQGELIIFINTQFSFPKKRYDYFF